MGILKNIKKNKVTADFTRFVYTVAGRPKSGKTSLVYKTIKEKFGNVDSLLLVAFEQGYGALDGINAIDIEDFSDFVDLVDELVEEKDNVPYKVIALDTVDIMQDLAIPYVVKKASKQDGKAYKKLIDIPWGGGWNMLSEEISNAVTKLQKAGYSLFFLTHDKDKSFETRDGLKYDKTTLSLTGKVRDICLNMSDFILFIELTKEMQDGKLVDKRKIHFRGDSTLECGSRLEDVPDYIDYDIKGFINTVEDAVLKAYGGDKEKMEKAKKEQQKEFEAKVEKFVEKAKGEDSEEQKQGKLDRIKSEMASLDMTKLSEIIKKHGVTSLADASTIPTECLDEILALL